MSIEVACACGQTYSYAEQFAGYAITCEKCGNSLTIPQPSPSAPLALGQGRWAKVVRAEPVAPTAPNANPNDPLAFADPTEAARERDRAFQARESGEAVESGGGGSGGLLGGLAMMGIAVVWFCGGLMADIIFFYPPILFIIGLVTCFSGMGNKSPRKYGDYRD